ncbi:hypothetical protein P8452_21488 [Trifolium repens]|nr:hypothetical protein P8452_21488 [Trifolium repens]
MEDYNFVVGQVFPDVKAFRNAIKEAAIAQHFELRIIKSDLIRYFAKCASDGCPWRIRAVKLPNASTFIIRSLEGTHTCGRNALNGHHQASVDWIVIERIHGNLITQFDDRRLKSSSWYSVLTPSAERRMVEAINHASTYQVLRSDEVEFEVISADRSDIVNIGSRSCSCRDWQLYGIPCSHAVAALISCRKDVYAYTAKNLENIQFYEVPHPCSFPYYIFCIARLLAFRFTLCNFRRKDTWRFSVRVARLWDVFGFRSADQINYVEISLMMIRCKPLQIWGLFLGDACTHPNVRLLEFCPARKKAARSSAKFVAQVIES